MSECLIVKGSGETDLPIVHIVDSLEEARHAVLSLMYSNPDDAEDTDELFAEFDDTMADDNYWTIAFEIGGISVERVCLATPTQGADARPVAITDEVLYKLWALALDSTEHEFKASAPALLATRDAAPSDAPIGYVNSMWAEHRVGTTKIYLEAHPRIATFPVFAAIAPREKT